MYLIKRRIKKRRKHKGKEKKSQRTTHRAEDAKRETRALARGSRRDFSDDGADERQAAANAQAAKEIGQRRGNAQPQQLPPARGPVELKEIDEVMVHRGQAERGIGEYREESDQKRTDQHRLARTQIDQQQRRDGDDRGHLHDDGERKKRAFDHTRLREHEREQKAANGGRGQRLECDGERDFERAQQGSPVLDQGRHDQAGRRQNDGLNVVNANHRFPSENSGEQRAARQRILQQLVAIHYLTPSRSLTSPDPSNAMASCRASEVARHLSAYSAQRRKSSPRGSGEGTTISATTRPGRGAMTTIRSDR